MSLEGDNTRHDHGEKLLLSVAVPFELVNGVG